MRHHLKVDLVVNGFFLGSQIGGWRGEKGAEANFGIYWKDTSFMSTAIQCYQGKCNWHHSSHTCLYATTVLPSVCREYQWSLILPLVPSGLVLLPVSSKKEKNMRCDWLVQLWRSEHLGTKSDIDEEKEINCTIPRKIISSSSVFCCIVRRALWGMCVTLRCCIFCHSAHPIKTIVSVISARKFTDRWHLPVAVPAL